MRFNDIDMLGHLNNGVYIAFFDLGKSRYFLDIMPDGVDWKHFHAPTYIYEEIGVVTTVTEMGEKSFVMEQRIVNTKSGEVKCVGRTVMVGFDIATGHSAPIEQKWIDAIERYEGRKL